jgi:hypothetical protein
MAKDEPNMTKRRRPRGFVGRRLYQLQHAPRPVFRAVFASGGSATIFSLLYLAYDVQVERALRDGGSLINVVGRADLRAEAAALLVLLTVVFGSLLTFLIVPQPTADGRSTQRSGWSAALGFFASLPIAYIALVVESQFLKPILLSL